ncbi:TonB-dependent receptor domain-containing protein [Endozoicomonas ascidiicola]|uniref:TonB-dependent receptor domain-containing protein n=1 Tax=Endozoicomonas ascidiicola TaxID=1698521 RepID=UPI000AD0B0D3|nr:TonB-dependent receptor [Endozoicomonas ascidiicola]
MKYFSFSPVLTSLALVICSTTALATEPKAYTMDRVVVSATRTAQSVDETLAPVSVITREDIERSQASSVPELLRTVPGVQFYSNGGRGSATSMFIRGASSAQTLVLIDGQRMNSATSGGADLQYLDPSQIERIEVVRGSVSSLYGADAIGGVVQIFTRKGKGEPHLSIRTAAGTENTRELGLNFGGKTGNTKFNFGTSLIETDGFDFTNDENTSSPHKGINLDDDGFRNKSISTSISHLFDNGIEAGVSFSHNKGKLHYDEDTNEKNPYNAYSSFENTIFNSYASQSINAIWFTRLDLGFMHSNKQYLGDNIPAGNTVSNTELETERHSLLWQNDVSWQENQLLTVGLDYYIDQVDGSNTYSEDSRYNAAIFIQNQTQLDDSNLQIALRQDKNESYGSNTTGNIAYGYNLTNDLRLIGSYGTAFRAPTFGNLYGKYGKPSLNPESSKNHEVALKGNESFGSWEISAFQNDIEDMIAYAEGTYFNTDKARIRGLEASIQSRIKGWDVYSAVTIMDPKDQENDSLLTRRARQSFNLSIDRKINSWSVGSTLFAQSESFEYDRDDNPIRLSGFATVDLRLAKQLNKEFKSEFKVTNLMDKEYSTAKGYNAPPRAGIISLTWTPEF